MLKIIELTVNYLTNFIGLDDPKPAFGYKIISDKKFVLQKAYNIQVSTCKNFSKIYWDSGKTESDISNQIEYSGYGLCPMTAYYVRAKIWDNYDEESDWSETAYWETGLMSMCWDAKWIDLSLSEYTSESQPAPYVRKSFTLKNKIRKARIYSTALGIYELYVNNQKISDYFAPGFTNYKKRLQYQAYDVTNLLSTENVIGAAVGDGWYRGHLAWGGNRNVYGDRLMFLAQLVIEYENGEKETIITDNSWKVASGPIVMSDIYNGEIYDSRLELECWQDYSYNDSEWVFSKESSFDTTIVNQENVPVTIIEEVKPISIIKTPLDETVIDFGQNMVGFVCFKVRGAVGKKVTLQHAEVLDADGNFYTENLRSAQQQVTYYKKSNDEESYKPHFTFQGFRYVKLEGFSNDFKIDDFIGCVLHSNLRPTGSFECSNELLNQLQHNIQWGQKGNFVDIPTDCPQRDERLGWTGDAQAFIKTACFNMNVAPFFNKWLNDLSDDQYANGKVPHVIPDVLNMKISDPEEFLPSAGWADASVICPWTIYLCYNDKKILARQYASMKAWVDYINNANHGSYIWEKGGDHFGDWLGLDSEEGSYVGATDKDYIASMFFAYSSKLVAKTARVLSYVEDFAKYDMLFENIKREINKKYIVNGNLTVNTQTAHVLALHFDIIDNEQLKANVFENLIKLLEEHNYHLTTGFLGTPYLCLTLSNNGRSDIAYRLLLNTDYPSWLYPITKGATTIWEHWDGIKEDGSFWSRDMNSFNHYAYGAIGEFLYSVVAGINIDEENNAYKHTIINPVIGGGLTYAKCLYDSLYGQIKSEWEIKEDKTVYKLEIPHNTTASFIIKSNNVSVPDKTGIQRIIEDNGYTTIILGSGSYEIYT